MILLVLSVCLAAELHQSEGSSNSLDALMTTNVDQQKEIVNKHNECRRTVQPPAQNMLEMSWDTNIAINAQQWAKRCTLEHSPGTSRIIGGNKCGENLFMSSVPSSWTSAIGSWFNEGKYFVYNVGASPKGAVIGHYTQVVWYRSHKVGCAVAYCPEAEYQYFYVCQYCPTGNMQGQLATPYKEGPWCGQCPNNCRNRLCTNPCTYRNNFSNCDALAKQWGCDHPTVKKDCESSCKCTTEIR